MSGSRPLSRLGLDEFTLTKLHKARVQTAKDLLECSPLFLMTNADLSLKEATSLIARVSERLASKPSTARQLLQRNAKKRALPSGLTPLDESMGGGFIVGTISEVCGPPGVGKTQLCLSACVQSIVQRAREENNVVNGTGKYSVIYIDTELKFDAQRLQEMALHGFPGLFQQQQREDDDDFSSSSSALLRKSEPSASGTHPPSSSSSSSSSSSNLDGLLRSVSVMQPTSSRELLQRIQDMQSDVISNGVRLVILDSVAALARREQLTEVDKDKYIVGQAAALKTLAESCNCVVLATNQIQPCGHNHEAHEEVLEDIIMDQGVAYRPSLGTVWQHCVTSRLVMCTDESPCVPDSQNIIRPDKVVILDKSPICATNCARIHFRIKEEGFVANSQAQAPKP